MRLTEPEYVDTIIVDYDEKPPLPVGKVKEVLSEFGLKLTWMHVKQSASGGVHYIIKTTPTSPDLVPLIELLLGSDPYRCCLLEFRRRHGFWLDVTWSRKALWDARYSQRKLNVFKVLEFYRARCPSLLRLVKFYAESKGLSVGELLGELLAVRG